MTKKRLFTRLPPNKSPKPGAQHVKFARFSGAAKQDSTQLLKTFNFIGSP